MDGLITLLVAAVLFALLAYAMYWVCVRFFPNFPPALWICGVVLLAILIAFVTGQLKLPLFPPKP